MTNDAPEMDNVKNSPWNVGDIVKAILLSGILIVVAIAAVVGGGLLLRVVGIHLENSRVLIVVALVIVQNLAFAVSVWVFGLRKYGAGVARLGLQPFAAGAGCAYAAFALLLSFGFNAFYGVVTHAGDQVQPPEVLPLFGGGLFGFALALFIASGLVPIVEETFFRGFLFPGLARRFGFAAGALLSAVLFGAAHLSGASFIPLSFFGLVLALLYGATGSIYPGIVMHSVNNSIALLATFFIEAGVLR